MVNRHIPVPGLLIAINHYCAPMQNEEKFLDVLNSHKAILYKVANAYVSSSHDRNDLIQEIIEQLWKSFENYNGQYRYSTWIYRIALNVSISFNRKEKSRKVISMPFTETLIQFADAKVQDEREHDLQTLEHFISQLKSFDKALILLYLEEKSSSEMAEILGISETNVTTRISRIKNALRQKFIRLGVSG